MVPVISFVAKSGTGKTTYLEKLIAAMKQRGYRVGCIKHDVHGFEIDRPGKDTWRHAKAGADVVCISSPAKMAVIKKVDQELQFSEVLKYITDVDIIFAEGYKSAGCPKVEIFRSAVCDQPMFAPEDLLAMAADTRVYEGVPYFSLDDAAPLADFIEQKFLRP